MQGRVSYFPLPYLCMGLVQAEVGGCKCAVEEVGDNRPRHDVAGLRDNPQLDVGNATGEEARDITGDVQPMVFEGGGGSLS